MYGKKRAYLAINCMTSRAGHVKTIAKYIIDNNEFTCKELAENTDVPRTSITRTLYRLEQCYSFQFEKTTNGRFTDFKLLGCNFQGTRKKIDSTPKTKVEIIEPLRKPLSMNHLWASALQMQL
ncbi:hypothetical protein MHBO_004434 [Bonamia ostreae]|uniref:Uncharacterized protein n=1 Tax=Bonamia ostreae TaxID=126728 RepID=A0ABV2ATB9_9EUKA